MRVAAVAGADHELGRAIVAGLMRRGWAVASFDAAQAPGTRSAALDLRDPEAVRQAVQDASRELGEIDCLITLADAAEPAEIGEIDHAGWRATLHAHLSSAANFAWAVLPAMVARGSGNIVTIGPDDALGAGGPGAHRGAAAGAVIGFTKALAIELAKTGVQVNAISTPLPTPRAEEVAASAVYLADEPHFFLGQVLTANLGEIA